MELQKEKEKVEMIRVKTEKTPKAEKMEKEKTRVKNHAISSQRPKKGVNTVNNAQGIIEC